MCMHAHAHTENQDKSEKNQERYDLVISQNEAFLHYWKIQSFSSLTQDLRTH